MRFYRLTGLLITTLLVLLMAGCGANRGLPDKSATYHPDWWQIQLSVKYIYSFGQAETFSRDASLEAARSDALLHTPAYVQTYLSELAKTIERQSAISDPDLLTRSGKVVASVSRARFSNLDTGLTQTIFQSIDAQDSYKSWLQLRIPKQEINRMLVNVVKSDSILYRSFLASDTFRTVEAALN